MIRSLALGLPRATDDRPTGIARARNLAAFGEDACGHVYVVSHNGGVYRVQDGALGPCVPSSAGTTPSAARGDPRPVRPTTPRRA